MKLKGTYNHGRKDGPYEKYYENGQLNAKGTYNDGKRDGLFESYLEDGRLLERGIYYAGEKCGEWIEDGRTVTHGPGLPDVEIGAQN